MGAAAGLGAPLRPVLRLWAVLAAAALVALTGERAWVAAPEQGPPDRLAAPFSG